MSRHQHHHRNKNSPGNVSEGKRNPRSWMFVVAVILMLIAMGVYVLTLDDSVVTEPGAVPEGVPASP